MSSWLKAGLIGGAVLVVFNLLGAIPIFFLGFVFWCLGLFAYIGAGVLAAFWMPPPRQAGPAAGQGAMAGAVSGVIGGIVYTIVSTIQLALTDTAALLAQLPPETLQQFEDAGLDPSLFVGPNVGLLCGAGCCLIGVILAAILGAIGGAVFAGLQPE